MRGAATLTHHLNIAPMRANLDPMNTTLRCRVVVLTACSSFKLAIVLGPSKVAGKLRVQTYSHASRCWSNPHTVPESDTRTASMAVLHGGQRRTLMHALHDGESLGAWCHSA